MIKATIFSVCFWSLSFGNFLFAEKTASEKLEAYKEFLIQGTYEGQDFSFFEATPKSRYDTFKYAFDYFEKHQGKVIVELGTTRSFVHGGHIGCNLDDPRFWDVNHPENWDWGAGFFTRMAATCLSHLNPILHTVDLAASHIARCKIITQDYSSFIKYYHTSSEEFLLKVAHAEEIDLLYMDTGDMTPIEPTALLHLREAKMVVQRNLIAPGGLILIDDVKSSVPKKHGEVSNYGKAKYALPYLLEHGFELVMDEYQVLLRKR